MCKIVVNGRERPIKEVPPTAIINIDGKAHSVAVGINYTTRLRIPSIEMQIQDGTLQGRLLTMSRLSINILNSFGGKIGRNFNHMDDISLPPLKFWVEKVGGTITDDSAITLPVINRKMYDIRHLIPANDLLILTSGNEWIIDGSKNYHTY